MRLLGKPELSSPELGSQGLDALESAFVPTMLTLGVRPRRDPRALFTGLLIARCDDPADAPASSSELIGRVCVPLGAIAADTDASGLVVRLDVEPTPGMPVGEMYTVAANADDLAEAVGLDLPAPLTVFCGDGDVVEIVGTVDRAGRHCGLDVSGVDLSGVDTSARDRVADFLAVVTHAERGFLARAADATEVLAVVAGTVAALRGDDIRRALRAPDLVALLGLHPDAAAATREVLLGVDVPDAAAVAAELEDRIRGAGGS